MAERVVLHVDMDAFFASVEQRDRPELRGKPVVVGHDGPRGVVAAASYEARRYGCRSAQPIAIAKRLCPELVIVSGSHGRYSAESRRIFDVFHDMAPLVEPLSIDEAFLDLTGTRRALGDPVAFAEKLRARILSEIELTASVGVAPNKYLAKLASDMDKPDGLTVIRREDVDRVLLPLPLERLWGVGPKTAERLRAKGLATVADVRALSRLDLQRLVGSLGDRLYGLSRGVDDRRVVPDHAARSISHECTFGVDVENPDEVRGVIRRHADSVGRRLRRASVRAATVSVKIRYGHFETITRRTTLPEPTDLTDEVTGAALGLFDAWVERSFRPVRLIGVAASGLRSGAGQLALFTSAADVRSRRVDAVLDGIKERFGSASIHRGATPPSWKEDEHPRGPQR